MTLLPPNASALEQGLEAAGAVPALPVPLRSLWDPATCAPELLPWLAWALSIDDWDATWPIAVRRAVVANSIAVHRRKGTVAAVRAALAGFGANMGLREWWEVAGTPGTFDVVLSIADQAGAAPSAAFVESVIAAVEQTKPLSRHFTFAQALAARGRIGLIGTLRPAAYVRLSCTAAAVDPPPAGNGTLDFSDPGNSGLILLLMESFEVPPSGPIGDPIITLFMH